MRGMRKFLSFVVLALCIQPALTQDIIATQKQKAREAAERFNIDLRLDQPYAGTTNPKQQVDVYLPKKRNREQPLPVVALIHGGGWKRGDRTSYTSTAIQLSRTGDFAAVTVGYRLTDEAKWPAQVHDCKAAIRWIRAHAKEWNLDGDKIAVWGSSAGGHLSSLLGTSGDVKEVEGDLGPHTRYSSRVACVVNHCGPEDFSQGLMFDKAGKPVTNDDAVMALIGGTFLQQPAVAAAASPITYVSKDDPPFITFHGTKDMRVAFLQAETLHTALNKVSVPSLLVPITDGGHSSVSHPEVRKRSEEFVRKILLGSEISVNTTPIPALPEKK